MLSRPNSTSLERPSLFDYWHLKLLGEMTAINGDRVVSRFRTQQAAALLTYLALHSGKPHLRDTLVDLIWPEDDIDSARTKLRIALSSLRRQFESPGSAENLVFEAGRASITLRTEAFQTDVSIFKDALSRSEGADYDHAFLTLAVDTYTGPFVPALHMDWIVAERDRLSAQFVRAALTLSDIRLRSGEHEAALQLAERSLRADPWNESSHIAFMNALAILQGPQHALNHFHKYRIATREQLGTEPGKDLIDCARRIQNNEIDRPAPTRIRLKDKTEVIAEPTQAVDVPPFRVPRPSTRYFGREDEVNRLIDRVVAAINGSELAERVITILGPGGTGKTRLSVEIARRVHAQHQIPVYFVPLEDVRNSGEIIGAVTRSLSQASGTGAGDSVSLHGNIPCLIILDNFEQLLDAGIAPVLSLLNRVPLATFLITSRQPLNIPEEIRVDWQPLPIPAPGASLQELAQTACVQLFIDRAQRIKPDFQITRRNAEFINAICRSVEGIPLAVEMAAAWTGIYTPSQLAQRLESHPLADRTAVRVMRHRTIANVIEWSMQLLPNNLRELFLSLAVFRGSWTAEAAAEICLGASNDSDSVLQCREMLARLRERSLLFIEPDSLGESLRYRFLETLREFAIENLPANEEEALAERHATYYMGFATEARSHLNGANQAIWYERQAMEHTNCLAALDWLSIQPGRVEEELVMATTLQLFWWTRGFAIEGCERLEQAIGRSETVLYPRALGRALRAAAILARATGAYSRATAYDERSLDIARKEEDWPAVAMILGGMGNTAKSTGDLVSARRHYAECIITAERIGHKKVWATAVGNLGNVALREGLYAEARECYDKSLAISRELGHMEAVAVALCNIATLANYQKNFAESRNHARQSLQICGDLGDMVGSAASIEVLAHTALLSGNLPESVQFYAMADVLRQKAGAPIPPDDRKIPDSDIENLRISLGKEEFETIWSKTRLTGDKMPIQTAMKLAGLEPPDEE